MSTSTFSKSIKRRLQEHYMTLQLSLPRPVVDLNCSSFPVSDAIQHILNEQSKMISLLTVRGQDLGDTYDVPRTTVIDSNAIVIDEQTKLLPCGSEEKR